MQSVMLTSNAVSLYIKTRGLDLRIGHVVVLVTEIYVGIKWWREMQVDFQKCETRSGPKV